MKTELKKLLAAESGTLKLNSIMHLNRWAKDAFGDPVDRLTVEYNDPIGRVSFYSADIRSRDTAGIIEEIAASVHEFSKKWAKETERKIRGGLF